MPITTLHIQSLTQLERPIYSVKKSTNMHFRTGKVRFSIQCFIIDLRMQHEFCGGTSNWQNMEKEPNSSHTPGQQSPGSYPRVQGLTQWWARGVSVTLTNQLASSLATRRAGRQAGVMLSYIVGVGVAGGLMMMMMIRGSGRTGSQLQMNRLSLRNNRLEVKISRESPIILVESIEEYTLMNECSDRGDCWA